MNWNRIEERWKQWSGTAMLHWEKITNNEMAAASGKYEDLLGKLQEGYRMANEEANEHEEKLLNL